MPEWLEPVVLAGSILAFLVFYSLLVRWWLRGAHRSASKKAHHLWEDDGET